MALNRARLLDRSADENGFIHVAVEFFDAAAPTEPLGVFSSTFLPGTVKADVVAAVRQAGRQRRDALANTAVVRGEISIGEVVTIT